MIEVDWARLKAHELRKLANENAIVILPIASIEQHGPHLPVMTDTRLGQEVAHRAARKAYAKRPVVVAPTVWSGLSEHHMPFGGTLTLSHDTFRRVLRDLIEAIARQGFKDILISNAHGGNIIAMQQILDELSPTSKATLVATTYVMEAEENLSQHLEDQPGVMHAGEAETSMMLVCEPDLVDLSNVNKIASPEGGKGFLSAGRNSYRWRPFAHMTENGLAGNPARSNAEKGENMLEAGAEALAQLMIDPETWAVPKDLRLAETGGVPFR
ncbi:MAG: creatininase family protein [Paracoccaceae bacterium]|nr:creatininase family protein [Paracoccaceae bacterium]